MSLPAWLITRSARSISFWMDDLNFQVSMSTSALLIVSESRVDAPQSRSRSEFPRCSTTRTNPFACNAVSTGPEIVACTSASNLVEPTVTKTSIPVGLGLGCRDGHGNLDRTSHKELKDARYARSIHFHARLINQLESPLIQLTAHSRSSWDILSAC